MFWARRMIKNKPHQIITKHEERTIRKINMIIIKYNTFYATQNTKRYYIAMKIIKDSNWTIFIS